MSKEKKSNIASNRLDGKDCFTPYKVTKPKTSNTKKSAKKEK